MPRNDEEDYDDDDDDVLRRVRRNRDAVDETLDFLGVKRRARREGVDEDDDDDERVGGGAFGTRDYDAHGKRRRHGDVVLDAMSKLSLTFAHGARDGGSRAVNMGRDGRRASTSATKRETLDLGASDMKALDATMRLSEDMVTRDAPDLELVVRNPRDNTSWMLREALKGSCGMSNASRLTSLTLRGGKGLSPAGFETLIRALGDARYLKKLDLSSCGLGEDAGQLLSNVLDESGCPLERLDLKGNSLGSNGAVALSKGLSTTKTLKVLNLAQNVIGAKGMEAVAEALARGMAMDDATSSIEDLDLQHNGCGDDGCSALAQHGLGNLQRLMLGFNGISASGARALADALKKRQRDEELDVGGDMDTGEGVRHIAKRMRSLDLKCNVMGSEGAQALSGALDNVESLDLSNNGVREGAKWIAKSLKNNSSIKELNLQANDMGDDDAWWIADAIGANKTLQMLNLGSNAFGDGGASDIAADLRENTSLKTLDLTRNGIGRQGASELMDALDENSTLTRLGLSSNKIPADTTDEMKRRVGVRAECDWQRKSDDAGVNAASMRFD